MIFRRARQCHQLSSFSSTKFLHILSCSLEAPLYIITNRTSQAFNTQHIMTYTNPVKHHSFYYNFSTCNDKITKLNRNQTSVKRTLACVWARVGILLICFIPKTDLQKITWNRYHQNATESSSQTQKL